MGGKVEIFQAAFAPCIRCGTIIRLSVRVSGKLENGKKPPKMPKFCDDCFRVEKARRRAESRK